VEAKRPGAGDHSEAGGPTHGDLILKAGLVVLLWLVLHFVGAQITTTVVVVTTVAIFGPDVLWAAAGWISKKD
jgi:hypothetical protein